MRMEMIRKADQKKSNLLIKSTFSHLFEYLSKLEKSCEGSENLMKIVMAKFPNLGYHLLQEFQDIAELKIEHLKKIYSNEMEDSGMIADKNDNEANQMGSMQKSVGKAVNAQ